MSELPLNKRKQHLLESAIRVFSVKGFDDASMREIAAEAGLTTGAIYHHYKNKDDLFYDAVKEAAYFVHKLSERNENSTLKTNQEMFNEISANVRDRMSKDVEQRLLILLAAYAMSKGGRIQEKYKQDYTEIIQKVADMYFFAFGVENLAYQKSLAAILVAALDGVALQYSLGILKFDDEAFKDTFITFFAESIPAFLRTHRK
ncbi:MAG: TetR/AcrR family transcriptional regulator [Erysipelotrichaceae bacterium]|nr:TetR/AcrR family transcriptional regulator [Erysipelotrichaceae bacterium]